MHNWIEIDQDALKENYRYFCHLLGADKVVPVLKANAYGHGLRQVYQCLADAGLRGMIGVNDLSEASELRELAFDGPILILGPLLEHELKKAAELQTDLTIGSPWLLKAWMDSSPRCRAWLKFDTGMGRLGFSADEAPRLATALAPYQSELAGISTHFANVEDVSDTSYPRKQLARLEQAREVFRKAGYQIRSHAASSASSLLMKESHLDLCRIGLSMYGLWPSGLTRMSWINLHGTAPLPLRPVLSWHSRVVHVRTLAAGDFVGYGCTFRAPSAMQAAVLPVGYSEGYARSAGEGQAWVLIRGTRCRILGRICMNMMMVDVTHLQQICPGEQVTLLGTNGAETISADTLASWFGTINYEVVSRINPGIPRHLSASCANQS
ncbi:MAG: alanine racemase [Deltaproteobacteria bacterium]|nr:alanine racemase [Deltaproteobacteria bacterium]